MKVIHILLKPLRYVKGKLLSVYQVVKTRITYIMNQGKTRGKKVVDKTFGGLKRKQNERKIKHKQKIKNGKQEKKNGKIDKKTHNEKKRSKQDKVKIYQRNRKKKAEIRE